MRRREFMALLGSAAVAWPLGAHAQQPSKVYRIAIVHPSNPVASMNEASAHPYYPAFFAELRRLGYVEGQNLVVERRSGESRTEHYSALVREVVALNPDLIFTAGLHMSRELKAATSSIPIVTFVGYPVTLGLAESLARPGGNITGISNDPGIEIYQKYIEIMKEAVPHASRIAWLTPRVPWERADIRGALREAARRVGIDLMSILLSGDIQEEAYRRAFATMAQERVDALVVVPNPENFANRRITVELAAGARLPALYPFREHVEIGGLMAYAMDLVDLHRRAAGTIAQILRGAKPGDIPFYQASKFDPILNLKTAKALGIEMPPSLLARADEVIE